MNMDPRTARKHKRQAILGHVFGLCLVLLGFLGIYYAGYKYGLAFTQGRYSPQSLDKVRQSILHAEATPAGLQAVADRVSRLLTKERALARDEQQIQLAFFSALVGLGVYVLMTSAKLKRYAESVLQEESVRKQT
jgi:hypothetical protein